MTSRTKFFGSFLSSASSALRFFEPLFGRQFVEQKEIRRFLETEPVETGGIDDILDVYAPVIQFAFAGHFHAVDDLFRHYVGNSGQTCDDSLAVQIPKPPFDLIFRIQFVIDHFLALYFFSQFVEYFFVLKAFHRVTSFISVILT